MIKIKYENDNGGQIPMPVYYWEDEETGEKHYDFEEMADVLEDRISKCLNREVSIDILELEAEE